MLDSVFSPPVVPQSIEVKLYTLPNSVRLSRRLVREWFRHWRLTPEAIEAGELIASELVTNAAKAEGQTIQLRVRWFAPLGYIEVWDADPHPPVPQEAGLLDEGGRGLFIVSQYAQRWSYYLSAGGKVVWAEVKS